MTEEELEEYSQLNANEQIEKVEDLVKNLRGKYADITENPGFIHPVPRQAVFKIYILYFHGQSIFQLLLQCVLHQCL